VVNKLRGGDWFCFFHLNDRFPHEKRNLPTLLRDSHHVVCVYFKSYHVDDQSQSNVILSLSKETSPEIDGLVPDSSPGTSWLTSPAILLD
jgi:hypothetical protein